MAGRALHYSQSGALRRRLTTHNQGAEPTIEALKARALSEMWVDYRRRHDEVRPTILLGLEAYEEAAAGRRVYLAPFPLREHHRPVFVHLTGRALDEALASVGKPSPVLRPPLTKKEQLILEFSPGEAGPPGLISGIVGVVVDSALMSAVVTGAWAGLSLLTR